MATNAQVDTAAAAVPAPYGPLTRVTDMSHLPTPNENILIRLTTASGSSIYMTYNQLTNPEVRDRVLRYGHGLEARVRAIRTWVNELDAIVDAWTTFGYNEYVQIITALRDPRNPLYLFD